MLCVSKINLFTGWCDYNRAETSHNNTSCDWSVCLLSEIRWVWRRRGGRSLVSTADRLQGEREGHAFKRRNKVILSFKISPSAGLRRSQGLWLRHKCYCEKHTFPYRMLSAVTAGVLLWKAAVSRFSAECEKHTHTLILQLQQLRHIITSHTLACQHCMRVCVCDLWPPVFPDDMDPDMWNANRLKCVCEWLYHAKWPQTNY